MARELDNSGRVLFDGVVDLGATHLVGDAGEPAFSAPWVNDGAAFRAGFTKFGGLVFVWGLVRNGNVGTTIFTLPAAYRPGQELRLPSWDVTGSVANSIRVSDTGPLIYQGVNGNTVCFGFVFAGP